MDLHRKQDEDTILPFNPLSSSAKLRGINSWPEKCSSARRMVLDIVKLFGSTAELITLLICLLALRSYHINRNLSIEVFSKPSDRSHHQRRKTLIPSSQKGAAPNYSFYSVNRSAKRPHLALGPSQL